MDTSAIDFILFVHTSCFDTKTQQSPPQVQQEVPLRPMMTARYEYWPLNDAKCFGGERERGAAASCHYNAFTGVSPYVLSEAGVRPYVRVHVRMHGEGPRALSLSCLLCVCVCVYSSCVLICNIESE